MYEGLKAKAGKAASDRRAAIASIESDNRLTPAGKTERIAEIERLYQVNVDYLRRDANMELDAARARNAIDLKRVRIAEVENRRAVIGDAALVALYRMRLEALPSDELQAAYEDSAPGWERSVVAEVGRAVLAGRIRAVGASVKDFQAANALAADVSPELRQLEQQAAELAHGEEFIESLDVVADSRRIADAFGVDVRFVELAASQPG